MLESSSITSMGQRARIRRFLLVVCAVLLVTTSLWATWRSATYWAPCVGADWTTMNDACAEAMSSYASAPIVELWAVLTAFVIAIVLFRAVSRVPYGLIAGLAAVLACPLLDPGFFWIEWGSADGIPGNGIWTAALLSVAGVVLLIAPVRSNTATPVAILREAATQPPSF